MEFRVIISRAGLKDLRNIEDFLTAQGVDESHQFCSRLVDVAQGLRTLPSRGSLLSQIPERRFVVYGRYLIVYKVFKSEEIVQVLRFWHSARDIRRLRLK